MASGTRKTDPAKWGKTWFRKLDPKHKLLWLYIVDHCDWAGIWDPDFELASFQIGAEVSEADIGAFGKRIEKRENGDFWVVGFISYQQPNGLNPKYKFHQHIVALVKKHRLPDIEYSQTTHQAVAEHPSNVTSRKVGSCKVSNIMEGEPYADWAPSDYVAAFRAIRPEFANVPEFAITTALAAYPAENWVGAFADFSRHMPNEVRSPNNPIRVFEGYLRNAGGKNPAGSVDMEAMRQKYKGGTE